ncbi:MAG TPA: hypothetical protein VF910_05620 [Candidatus Bathyarchaeia archaeon]
MGYQRRATTSKPAEDTVLRQVSEELRRTHLLTSEQKQALSKVFEKRFPQALAIVEARKVTSYRFKPSGRTLWVVKGRKGEYQVMPESMFCTCDDYYFRVMDNKKQLCYHLVAQQIAEALSQYGVLDFADSQYAEVTSKWSDPSYQMGETGLSG